MLRLDVIKAVSSELKDKGVKIRVVTNGHGNLINGSQMVKEITGLVDRISVSLNAHTGELYEKICKPQFGAVSYKAVIDFIKECVANNIEVEVTCLDLPGIDVKKCEEMALAAGGKFRLRRYGVVG